MTRACCYCDSATEELRPYGPKGAWLCFGCMKATPEREAAAAAAFMGQLTAAGPVAVIGEETGPRPLAGGAVS